MSAAGLKPGSLQKAKLDAALKRRSTNEREKPHICPPRRADMGHGMCRPVQPGALGQAQRSTQVRAKDVRTHPAKIRPNGAPGSCWGIVHPTLSPKSGEKMGHPANPA